MEDWKKIVVEVRYTVEDLKNYLEDRDIPQTEENVSTLIDAMKDGYETLEDKMLEAGYYYIMSAIDELKSDEEFNMKEED